MTRLSAGGRLVPANEAILSGCHGKLPYTSKIDALSVIARRKQKHSIKPKGRGQMQPYKCRHCDRWHIGSVSIDYHP